MVFASPAWGADGISAHLRSMKAPEPGPSLGKWSVGQWEIRAPLPTVLLWMGARVGLGLGHVPLHRAPAPWLC